MKKQNLVLWRKKNQTPLFLEQIKKDGENKMEKPQDLEQNKIKDKKS